MDKIDAHQHFWKFNPQRDQWITEEMAVLRRDFLPQHLQPLLVSNGFEGSVLVQSSQDDLDFLLECSEKYPFVKGVVGWVDFLKENLEEELERLSQYKKVKGFRHVLQSEPDRDFMLRKSFQLGISKLQSFEYTYDILVYPDQLTSSLSFVKAFPNQPFVVDHIAKPAIKAKEISDWAVQIKALAAQEHVCCKISGLVTEADWHYWRYDDLLPYLDVVVEAFGVNRIMYGSDWPVCLLAADYNEVVKIIERYFAGFTTNEQDKIFGGTASAFYKLT